jgi:hypothetical protein
LTLADTLAVRLRYAQIAPGRRGERVGPQFATPGPVQPLDPSTTPLRHWSERVFNVELRGFEPLAVPAEMAPELGWMFFDGVTQRCYDMRICVGVLRDVTVLGRPTSISEL